MHCKGSNGRKHSVHNTDQSPRSVKHKSCNCSKIASTHARLPLLWQHHHAQVISWTILFSDKKKFGLWWLVWCTPEVQHLAQCIHLCHITQHHGMLGGGCHVTTFIYLWCYWRECWKMPCTPRILFPLLLCHSHYRKVMCYFSNIMPAHCKVFDNFPDLDILHISPVIEHDVIMPDSFNWPTYNTFCIATYMEKCTTG